MATAAASNWGLITNIVNSIVGVSVLTMPFCFKQCGIVLGALLLVFCSWMTHQSCMFLVKCASLSKRRTYAGLAFHAYGKAGKMLVETSMIGLMLGTCVAFYVVIGDLGSHFFARLSGFQVGGALRVLLLFAVSLCIVLPLSLQRNVMGSIQSFSAMALLFYAVFMFVMVLSSLKHGLFGGRWLRRVSYVRWEGVFRCIPIFGMSFACQSQVLPTYDSLDEPSVKAMSSIFASSLHVVTTFYVMVGFFGYVSFTEATAGNVLMHFPSNLVTEMIHVGFMMSVAVGFPMMILPCRQALNTLLFEQQQKDGTFAAGGYMPPLRFKVLTLAVVFGTMVGGMMIPSVETILGLTGATMGSLICFICPALIHRKVHRSVLSSQVVLWVGLGVLVVSTLTTLSVSDEAPADLAKEAPGSQLGEDEGVAKAEAARLAEQEPAVDAPRDGRGQPRPPEEKEELEQAQIKGPMDVPAEADTKYKQEAAQLDRPGQGVAVPVGEAHRHEPPVPHDEVLVDEGQDQGGPGQDRAPSRHADARALGNKAQMAPPLPDSERERPGQHPALGGEEGLPEALQKVPEANGQPPVQALEEDPGPGNRDPRPVPRAASPRKQHAPAAGGDRRADEAPADDVPYAGRPLDSGPGGKAPLLDQQPAPGAGPRPEVQEQRDAERPGADTAGKLEEAGRAGLLDHAVLLRVIQEQQVQQKRLLDQQEKLLAVIEEQHKEIHQQRQDGEEERPRQVDMQPEPGVAAPLDPVKEALGKTGVMAGSPPVQPLEPILESPGDVPAVPQQLGQQSLEEPKGAMDRPPGGASDMEPQAAQAQLQAGHEGVLPEAAGAGKGLEQLLVPDPARVPAGSEKRLTEDLPRQSQGTLGGGPPEKKRSGDKAAGPGADMQEGVGRPGVGMGVEAGGLHVASSPVNQGLGLAVGQSSRSGGAVAPPQVLLHQPGPGAISDGGEGVQQGRQADQGRRPEAGKEALRGDHGLAPHEHPRAEQDAAVQEPRQRLDKAEGSRELKLQAGSDLRRRRRDLAPPAEGEPALEDGVVISFNALPDVQGNDLRSALGAQLRQAAGAALQVVHSRQIRQLPGAPEEA
ncbi:putative sodium-coupled neutral amino acid transporter 10 isoform X2 [Tupaia chinensis]|uniref:putative sodium-coupled neutral amino acid transporter 10 isoform X1 n=2 Tax=Tupaia chinensis TaxID=246437 RepID=UPI0003C8D24A|nr:putative sodium-coupled neutral amino acid transporter 10 isoform X1 [Tupaia chinensis]XP_027626537.1 putative sodium-coupled neutral amino acid transporter 10 isoform X2 [Tupaia chinensis]